MILNIKENHKVIPHFQNILDIHKSNLHIALLTPFNPMFAGGYPMALLFAPREKHDNQMIKKGFYSDYDVYFSDQESYEGALNTLKDPSKIIPPDNIIETDNATTFCFPCADTITGYPLQIQLVKKIISPPKEILKTFDFINCAVGFSPTDESLYMHKEVFKYHNCRELEILDPWMLNQVTEETKNNVVIQISRFRKYCERWDYTLGSKAFWKLIEVYNKYPKLKTERGIVITAEGQHAYSGVRYLVEANTNIWGAMLSLLNIHPEWKNFKDSHGYLVPEANDSFVSGSEILQDDIPF